MSSIEIPTGALSLSRRLGLLIRLLGKGSVGGVCVLGKGPVGGVCAG